MQVPLVEGSRPHKIPSIRRIHGHADAGLVPATADKVGGGAVTDPISLVDDLPTDLADGERWVYARDLL